MATLLQILLTLLTLAINLEFAEPINAISQQSKPSTLLGTRRDDKVLSHQPEKTKDNLNRRLQDNEEFSHDNQKRYPDENDKSLGNKAHPIVDDSEILHYLENVWHPNAEATDDQFDVKGFEAAEHFENVWDPSDFPGSLDSRKRKNSELTFQSDELCRECPEVKKYERIKCEECGKSIVKPHMVDHKRIHSGERYPCKMPNCIQTFGQKTALARHIKNQHMGTIYQCQDCEKQFRDKSNLERHRKFKHDVENTKKYICDGENCDYITMAKQNLQKHQKRFHQK